MGPSRNEQRRWRCTHARRCAAAGDTRGRSQAGLSSACAAWRGWPQALESTVDWDLVVVWELARVWATEAQIIHLESLRVPQILLLQRRNHGEVTRRSIHTLRTEPQSSLKLATQLVWEQSCGSSYVLGLLRGAGGVQRTEGGCSRRQSGAASESGCVAGFDRRGTQSANC